MMESIVVERFVVILSRRTNLELDGARLRREAWRSASEGGASRSLWGSISPFCSGRMSYYLPLAGSRFLGIGESRK